MIKQPLKILFLLLGWLFVAVGFVGVFVPLLPTVPFLLLAAFCFERGSPRLRQWLYDQPRFGPALREWDQHRVIRPRAKLLASVLITLSIGYVVLFRPIDIIIKGIASATGLILILFLVTQKSYPDKD